MSEELNPIQQEQESQNTDQLAYEMISAKRWAAEPKGRKGYVLITDSIVNDVSPFGIPYQHYRMVAIDVPIKRRN